MKNYRDLYEAMTATDRAAIDEAFNAASKVMRAHFGRLNMCDPSERVVDALSGWVKESREAYMVERAFRS